MKERLCFDRRCALLLSLVAHCLMSGREAIRFQMGLTFLKIRSFQIMHCCRQNLHNFKLPQLLEKSYMHSANRQLRPYSIKFTIDTMPSEIY